MRTSLILCMYAALPLVLVIGALVVVFPLAACGVLLAGGIIAKIIRLARGNKDPMLGL